MRRAFSGIVAVVAFAAAGAGCRSVTIVSFELADVTGPAPHVDRVLVETPVKKPISVGGLDETVGFYDLSGLTIHIKTSACSGNSLVLSAEKDYDLPSDRIPVHLMAVDGPLPCPDPADAGTFLRPDAGGLGGGPGAGGAGGEISPDAGLDRGGSGGTNSPDASSMGGSPDRDAEADDTGECGDDTHAPACDPPAGDAGIEGIPTDGGVSAECNAYCESMDSYCSTSYESKEVCLRYCTAVRWPVIPGDHSHNSLDCRAYYVNSAATVQPFQRASFCAAAAAEGSPECGSSCGNFCAAWITLCNPSSDEAAGCMSACASAQTGPPATQEPGCRFELLRRALTDRRYCDYVSFRSCLRCN